MKVLDVKNTKALLDKRDWKILKELIQNPRQPLSAIAKKCLLSRQSVEYRLNKMKQSGIITGFRTVIDIKKIGYHTYHTFFNLKSTQDEDNLKNRAIGLGFVNAIITYKGKYAVEIAITSQSIEVFFEKFKELVSGINVLDDISLIITDTVKAEVLPFKQVEKNYVPSKMDKSTPDISLDAFDLKILKLLSEDATVTNIALSKKLRSSKDTISYRIRRLQRSGYILEYRPVVNYYSLDYSIHTVLIKMDQSNSGTDDIEKFAKTNPAILWMAKTFGDYDYIIYMISKDLNEFHDVFNEIKNRFGNMIRKYELLYAYNQQKYSFFADCIISETKI